MANTVILKWNPAVSSYNMIRFLDDIAQEVHESDWSIWEHERVRTGDTFYMLKVGCGQTGIVMRGKITSDPAPGGDWSGRGRPTFYCDYDAEIMINPDTFPLLDSEALRDNIPEFDWTGGHAGVVLPAPAAKTLETMWKAYLRQNMPEFGSRLELIGKRGMLNDQLYIARSLRRVLNSQEVRS